MIFYDRRPAAVSGTQVRCPAIPPVAAENTSSIA